MFNKEGFYYHFSAFGDQEFVPKETPPLFQDLAQIYIAGNNPHKIETFNQWIKPYGLIHGDQYLKPKIFIMEGEEAPWENAILVSRDKVERTIIGLKGEFGADSLIVASDVVVWIGIPSHQIPYQNLSRKPRIGGNDIDSEIRSLQQNFSRPTIVTWDVALSLSRKAGKDRFLQATIADRIVVHFNPINPKLIDEAFREDIRGALGRNTRVKLIDDPRWQASIGGIEVFPMTQVVGKDGHLREWHHSCISEDLSAKRPNQRLLEKAQQQIVGGMPVNGRLDQLVNLKVSRNDHKWHII